MQLLIKIHLFNNYFTDCCLTHNELTLSNVRCYALLGLNCVKAQEPAFSSKSDGPFLCVTINAYFLQPFIEECANSSVYRANVLNNLYKVSDKPESDVVFLKLKLTSPDSEIIDYAWNERIQFLVWSRIEIENAFSWLSTLGGAYSALGDHRDYCAEEAGRISIRQYKLSRMLGDEGLAARSCLYLALSHSQKGKLKIARRIVRNIVNFAIQTHDKRLHRMCLGVWAKLRYLRGLNNKLMCE